MYDEQGSVQANTNVAAMKLALLMGTPATETHAPLIALVC